MQGGELLADDRADLGVRTRGVGLELDHELGPVVEEAHVRRADRGEDRVAAGRLAGDEVVRGPLHRLPGLLEAEADDGQEELLLRAEQLEHVRLGDAGPGGDRLGRRADEAAGRELLDAGGDDRVAPLIGGHPGRPGHRCHRGNLVLTK